MQLGYRTQGFVLENGERYCLLVDPSSGMPPFYPNLFVTTQVRNRSLSAASMDAASAAINVLLTYCTERGIDLESRIRGRRFFNPAELDAIRDECQKRRSKHGGVVVVPIRGRNAKQRVHGEDGRRRGAETQGTAPQPQKEAPIWQEVSRVPCPASSSYAG